MHASSCPRLRGSLVQGWHSLIPRSYSHSPRNAPLTPRSGPATPQTSDLAYLSTHAYLPYHVPEFALLSYGKNRVFHSTWPVRK